MIKKIFIIFSVIASIFAVNAVNADETKENKTSSNIAKTNNSLILHLKNGDVEIELFDKLAPNHVARIKQLVADKAYDNVVFHRVIDGFMAQTGDVKYGKKDGPNFDLSLAGMGGSSYPNLEAEFSSTPFERGVVGMARSQDINSANSQFFICFKSARFLDNKYTVIGKVKKGMDIVDQIKKGDPQENGKVTDPDEIISAEIK